MTCAPMPCSRTDAALTGDPASRRIEELWHRLLERFVSEYGPLCRDAGAAPARRSPPQVSFMFLNTWELSQVGRQLAQRLESRDLGAKLVPNVASPPHTIRTCRHTEDLSVCSMGFA